MCALTGWDFAVDQQFFQGFGTTGQPERITGFSCPNNRILPHCHREGVGMIVSAFIGAASNSQAVQFRNAGAV